MPDTPRFKMAFSDETESKTRSLTSAACEVLRADILACRLFPNAKLHIQRLCVRYQVGATALREALSRLVAEGLVVAKDQRGFYVAPVSRADLLDVTKARIQIECLALRESIQTGDTAWEARVVGTFHQLSRTARDDGTPEAHGLEQWSRLHRDFHLALISACSSNWIRLFCKELLEQSERYRNLLGKFKSGRKRNVDSEHQDIMQAVLARDADLACKRLSEHFWTTTQLILESSGGKDAAFPSEPFRKPDNALAERSRIKKAGRKKPAARVKGTRPAASI